MKIEFFKYQGTGNDFIIIDDRQGKYSNLTRQQIEKICARRFGIGADGLILLQLQDGFDFKMKYYNADGNESTMCGNGGRCIVRFAAHLGVIENNTTFIAIDGPHEAVVLPDIIQLKMQDVASIRNIDGAYILNTGSPHFVQPVEDVEEVNVFFEGKKIRNSEPFKKEGINVNFLQQIDNGIIVRTYERGVENETYSCGTGVVAAALTDAYINEKEGNFETRVNTKGGVLSVRFSKAEAKFVDVWLNGPAEKVFEGTIEI